MLIAAVALWLAAFATFDESYRAGLQALAQNRLADAKIQLEAAAGMEPSRSRVWLALARTYWKLHDSARANDAAARAAQLAGTDTQVYQLLAVHYREAGQPLKACEMVAESDAPQGLDCYLQAGSPELAIQTGAARWLERAEVRAVMARAYVATRQFPAAEGEFEAAIRLQPREERYRFEYANSLLQRQQFERAITVLEAARREFAESPQIALALGVGYYGLRRFGDAAAAFERTIALDASLEQPYLFLGRILDQVPGRLAELTRLFAAFEQAHADSYVGYLLHAKALVAARQPAELLFRKAIALNPQLAEPHYELGVLAEQRGDYGAAAGEFEAAAGLAPADAVTHYHLARIYDRSGKPELAKRERELHRRLMNAAPDAAAK